jgi:riboflavin synthase
MFTGIITDVGELRAATRQGEGDLRLVIATRYAMDEVALGASIACSGICLTVVDKG